MATLDVNEAVKLGAVDAEFFYRTFFPKTFRQPSPQMHREIDELLDSPQYPMLNVQCFRGSAKTTKLRAFMARRIAYRMTRTGLFIGGSETAAARSVRWIRRQVEKNKLFANTFGLRPGTKWTDTELEIICDIDQTSTYVLAMGILSNVRGVNFDDYRPDLIVADDPLTDENVLTLEGREKTEDLLLGAIAKSLAPRTEEPNAKLALLQTPIHLEDASMKAAKSTMWKTVRFPCWTKDTEDSQLHEQRSSWEERFPTADLQKEKADFAAQGKSHIFTREMEVRITSTVDAPLKVNQVQYYDDLPKGHIVSALGIDPVPPPSSAAVNKNLAGRDYEVLSVWSRVNGKYYCRAYEMNRGHDPNWTMAKFFELALTYNISYVSVETIAYQATLKWLLEKEMQRRSRYYTIIQDKNQNKSKFQKIVDTISPLLQQGKLMLIKNQTELITQLTNYPKVPHDDVLDASAITLRALINPVLELSQGDYTEIDESSYEPLSIRRGCP